MSELAEVTIVNGRKSKGGKKGKGKRSMAKKRHRRRRRRNTENPANPPRRRRRRRRNPESRARRAYHRVRSGFRGGFRVDVKDDLKWGLHRLAGKVAAAWAVMKWGDKPGANPGGPSPTSGDRWSIKNFVIAWIAAYAAGELGARFFRINGQQVYNGGIDLMLTKAFWSEIVGRIPGGRQYLGRPRMGQLPAGEEGDIMQDSSGTQWIHRGGRWVSMMGIEAARPLDGYGEVTEARALDGMDQIETARALDGYQQRQLQERAGLGHYMDPASTSPGASSEGAYLRRGSADPFQAAYL